MNDKVQNFKTWIEVSRANLLHNLGEFKKMVPRDARIMAVLKANAYGHGIREVAEILRGQPNILFGVDSLQEAEAVRSIAKQPIMILGYIPKSHLSRAINAGFHISVYSREAMRAVAHEIKTHCIPDNRLRIHLKVETGTNRLGIGLEELANIPIPFPVYGLYTHFADSEDLRSNFLADQLAKLHSAEEILREKDIIPKLVHSNCTAAAIRGIQGGNCIRVGIGLYGLWPDQNFKDYFRRSNIHLRPALSWKTRIAQVKHAARGETVGYGRTWEAASAMHIAVLPVGYYDGLDRRLSSRGMVLIKGIARPIIGRICMNMAMVDIGKIPAHAGDEVTLIGASGKREILADHIAKKIGTINYEIISRINPLIPRIVK